MGKVWHVSIPRSLEPINNVRSFLLILTPSLEDGEDVERATEAPDVNFEMAAPAGKYENREWNPVAFGLRDRRHRQRGYAVVSSTIILLMQKKPEASEDQRALKKVG